MCNQTWLPFRGVLRGRQQKYPGLYISTVEWEVTIFISLVCWSSPVLGQLDQRFWHFWKRDPFLCFLLGPTFSVPLCTLSCRGESDHQALLSEQLLFSPSLLASCPTLSQGSGWPTSGVGDPAWPTVWKQCAGKPRPVAWLEHCLSNTY